MGIQKKRKAQQKKNKKNKQKVVPKPFVSICTPTFNRRPFFESTIKCYLHQDYPHELMEWIIIDDGTDKVEDLVSDISGVKYFKFDEKMTLGKKRNLMHEKCKGDIIVYMDDDDYYPSTRVSHAVQTLQKNKNALCAGSSEIYIWFKHIQKMYQFGPYGPKHATAGTFAFKRELLKQTSYEETASLAEEKHFLKNYTIPFVQLEPRHTILVFSHVHNTFDKKKLLVNAHPKFVKESDKSVDYFIKEQDLKEFYMEKIEGLLENYEPGLPKYKPDVLKQTAEIEEKRRQQMEEMQKNGNGSQIILQQSNGDNIALNNNQIVDILKQQQQQLQSNKDVFDKMKAELDKRGEYIKYLQQVIGDLQNKNQELLILLNVKKSTQDESLDKTKETTQETALETTQNITIDISE